MELSSSLKSLRWQRWAWGPVSRLLAQRRFFQITCGSLGTSCALKRYLPEAASLYQ